MKTYWLELDFRDEVIDGLNSHPASARVLARESLPECVSFGELEACVEELKKELETIKEQGRRKFRKA